MSLTDYQAKYFAHELTRRFPPDSVEKLTAALVDAQVDLNPHQIDAAPTLNEKLAGEKQIKALEAQRNPKLRSLVVLCTAFRARADRIPQPYSEKDPEGCACPP